MTLKQILLLAAIATVGLAGCGKEEGKPAATLSDATSIAKTKEAVQEKQAAAAPRGDKLLPLENYQEITSGKQLLYGYLAASTLPVDFEKIAASVSQQYRIEQDEFKKRDMLTALKPAILKEVDKAKQNRYYYMVIDGHPTVEKYDFSQQAFSIPALRESTGYHYFYDVSDYKLSFSNSPAFRSLKVADENAARNIESLRSNYQALRLIVYFFANDAELGEPRLKGEIMRIRLVDKKGTVLAEQ